MLRVYVAGPLTKPVGHEMPNVRRAIDAAQSLFKAGFAPFVPHLNNFWFLVYPENTYEEFIAWDKAWVLACDALLRLEGYSEGADREVAFARLHGIPVFTTVEELVEWRDRTRGMRFPSDGLECAFCGTEITSIIEANEEPKFDAPGIAISYNDGPIKVISSATCQTCYVVKGAEDES